jgi:hypothetical protein
MQRTKAVTQQKLPGENCIRLAVRFNQHGKPKPATEILASEIHPIPLNSKYSAI